MKVKSVMNSLKTFRKSSVAVVAAAIATICIPISAKAATYYISDCGVGSSASCGVAGVGGGAIGDDSRSSAVAQNPLTPWKTCAKFTSFYPSLAAGDVVLFAKGSAQDACQFYFLKNTNSTKSSPIRVGMYVPPWTDGTEGKPRMNGTTTFTVRIGGSGTVTPHHEGLILEDLNFVGPGTTSTMAAILIGADSDWITLRRLEISEFKGGVQCDSGNINVTNGNGISEHLTITHNYLHNLRGIGILSSCQDTTITFNDMDKIGVGNLDHHIYLDDSAVNNVAQTANRFTIAYNRLSNNTPYATSGTVDPTNGGCKAVAIVAHGQKNQVDIYGNELTEPFPITDGRCWGIAIATGQYQAPYNVEGIRYANIFDNKVTGFSLSIGVAICKDCVVANNRIYSAYSGARGIVYPVTDYLANDGDDIPSTHFTAQNNSIYLKTPANGTVGIQVSRDGTGHIVTSNIVRLGATVALTSCFNTDGKNSSTVHSDATFQLANTAFTAWGYNACSADSGTPVYAYAAGVTKTSAQFDTWFGSSTHSVLSDPLFPPGVVNANDLNPGIGSPMLGAGHPTLSSKNAADGKVRGNLPDIGATQRGATVVSPGIVTGVTLQ